jgi:hypothetical protein
MSATDTAAFAGLALVPADRNAFDRKEGAEDHGLAFLREYAKVILGISKDYQWR